MSKRKTTGKGNQAGRQSHKGPDVDASPSNVTIPSALVAGGALGLLLALIGSGMLSYTHLADVYPPGCGPGSGCAEATRSAWGSVLGWPTSHIGLAYFLAMAVAWFVAVRQGVGNGLIFIARLGSLASIMLTIVMFTNGYVCRYCLMAHGGNLLFWLCAEVARRQATGASMIPLKAAVGAFVLATVALIPVEVIAKDNASETIAKELDEDLEKITIAPPVLGNRSLFTGRYLLGPEKAAIRIVALTDYQCPDCQRFEKELRGIMDDRDDISLSVKQFPMSNKCNRYLPQDMHANACMAARAAETAGIIGGNDAFWDMHFWLFDQGGEFTDATFRGDLEAMGYDYGAFVKIMLSDQTLDLVLKDIEEGVKLGLHFTPMVFINGQELRNPHHPGTITKAIERLTNENLVPMTIAQANDTPPTAEQKYVNDWKSGFQPTMPDDPDSFAYGAENPVLDIVIWGDYSEFNTVAVDTLIRRRMKVQSGIRYEFRHYPMNQSCNPEASQTKFPMSCLAAQAVEAATILGGPAARKEMHASMMANYVMVDERVVNDAAKAAGVEPVRMMSYLNTPDVSDAILDDVAAAKQLGLQALPYIFINGKQLQRIKVGAQYGIMYIFDDSLGELTEQEKLQMSTADLGGIGSQKVRYTNPDGTPATPNQ